MGPYIDRCVPFQIMCNQLNLPIKLYKIFKKDDQWKQDASELNFESHSKGLNTYVNKEFLFFICYKFANISKNLFLLCHYAIWCVD